MASEQEIGELLASGHIVQAFEMLINAFQHEISGSRIPCCASAPAQETLLRVWRALPHFRGESSLSTWIYAIARNYCLTAIQRSSGKRRRACIEREGFSLGKWLR